LVTAPDRHSSDIYLPHHPHRHHAHLLVQDVELHVRYRSPDRHHFPLLFSPHRRALTSTAASVGPYRFSNSTHPSRSLNRSTRLPLNASPLLITKRKLLHSSTPSSLTNYSNSDGTKCITVTCSALINSRR